MIAKADTDEDAIELCEDLENKIAALAALAKDEDGRTAIEIYRTALRRVIRSAKERGGES